jgi:hypothetical protein
VTIGQPASDQAQNLADTPRKASALKRIGDWFWRGSALDKVRAAMPEPGPRAATFANRAHECVELAKNSLAPEQSGEVGSDGNACEIHRQACYWALCALSAQVDPELRPEEAERIWDALPEALLVQAAPNESRAEVLQHALRAGSFVYFAELPQFEQTVHLAELSKLSQALLKKLAERSVVIDAVYLQRAWRLAFLGVLALGVAMIPAVARRVIDARNELSVNKPWRTSSKYDVGNCKSPSQHCAESVGYFFHTLNDATPWVEIDLGTSQKVSKVRVENRSDCCSERADPLIIEVSSDQKHWRKVANHEGEFSTWEAKFNPVSTRYVRVRLMRQDYFHLDAVHVY